MIDLAAALDNLWFLLNFVEGLLFLAAAVYFTAKPEQTRFMISNFAHLSKEKRARYDMAGLSRYVCRALTACGVICIVGAVACRLRLLGLHAAVDRSRRGDAAGRQ